jgi:hypothetical protein
MNGPSRLKSEPARILSALGLAAHGALGALVATSVALFAFVVIGIIAWAAVRGLQGVGICGAFGAAVGAILRTPRSRLARVLGGGVGGVVAGYFAVASAEAFPPGTAAWAYVGATYAALFALPAAAFVGGLIGLLSAVSRSLGTGSATETKNG